jgi:hypothetical protein
LRLEEKLPSIQNLTCYQIHDHACKIVPAKSERVWMDTTDQRFAYRCLPLSIANAMGWELLLPAGFKATWNGGNELSDITLEASDASIDISRVASSHFGHGVLTFHVGYLFRTDPGIAILARGIPNSPKDGIAPLEGIVETDWLDFTFSMNWKFTRPGTVSFAEGEAFCFITLLPYHGLDDVVPRITPLQENPDIEKEYQQYSNARLEFNARLAENDPQAAKLGWQKWYTRGENSTGKPTSAQHITKLRLASPAFSDKKNAESNAD